MTKYKKKLCIYFIVNVLLVIGLVTIYVNKSRQDKYILKFAIYPVSSLSTSYYILLDKDGILTCSKGERKNNDIRTRKFLRYTYASECIKLEESEFEKLIELLDSASKSSFKSDKRVFYDSHDILLLINRKQYKFNYHFNNAPESLIELRDLIINLSPIPVEMRGWRPIEK